MTKLIGTAPNQVPTNADLGTMAYQDHDVIAPILKGGRRNILFNGDMRINQRGDQTGITNGRYTLDRWQLGDGTGGTFTVSQSNDAPSGLYKSLAFSVTTADTSLSGGTQYVYLVQKLEGQDLWQLGYGTPEAKSVTLSFWVKSSKTGQFASELEIPGSKVNVQTWSVNTANTWEYKTVTFEGNTSTAITTSTSTGMWVVPVWLAAGDGISGPNFQTGWQNLNQTERLPENIPNMADSTSNSFKITGVQLEVGKVATPFEHRSYGEELALCQRYFERYYPAGQMQIYNESSTSNHKWIRLNHAIKRSAPSLAGSSGIINKGTNGLGTISSLTRQGGSIKEMSIRVGMNQSSGTANAVYHFDPVAGSAYFDLDCEL